MCQQKNDQNVSAKKKCGTVVFHNNIITNV